MNDGFNSSDDAFTADEEADWGAMSSGEAAPEPASAPAPAAGGEAAPAPAAPAAAPAGEAAAPGEVVDPENEDGGADENKGKFVRHGAFHQERELRKAAQRERDEFRVTLARMEERFRIMSEGGAAQPAAAAAQAPAEPETPPDPNEDIFGYAKYLEKQIQDIRAGQTQLTEAQKTEQAQRAEATQRNEVLTAYRGDVQRTIAAEPAFAQAYEHLFSGRIAELQLLGVPEADAVQAVREEEFGIVQAAIQAGQSPAARLMQLAKLRGFASKAAEPAAAPAAPAETAAEKSARIAKGQAASLSLSSAGGAPAGEITLEMLASMSEADFAKMEKANPGRVKALMGG